MSGASRGTVGAWAWRRVRTRDRRLRSKLAIFSMMLALDQHALERRSLARNELLFRQGDAVAAIYFIEMGCLRLERRTFDGRTLILGTTRANEFFVEAALFSDIFHCDAVASMHLSQGGRLECAAHGSGKRPGLPRPRRASSHRVAPAHRTHQGPLCQGACDALSRFPRRP